MDHDATREQIELAGLEPGGIDRLMAGDTPASQAVAGHLAGCAACTDELARLERASGLIRESVRQMAPPDLRERTLATVRAAGVGRPTTRTAGSASASGAGTVARVEWRRGSRRWVAAIAAAVVLSVASTALVVNWQVDRRLAAQAHAVEDLQKVAMATLAVTAEPDVRRVALTAPDGSSAGSLMFSPSTTELVVVVTGLTPPPDGQEYRCWVEQAGERERVGKMFFGADLAYWIGPVPAVEGLLTGATFGVSLVDASGAGLGSEPVLGGGL